MNEHHPEAIFAISMSLFEEVVFLHKSIHEMKMVSIHDVAGLSEQVIQQRGIIIDASIRILESQRNKKIKEAIKHYQEYERLR